MRRKGTWATPEESPEDSSPGSSWKSWTVSLTEDATEDPPKFVKSVHRSYYTVQVGHLRMHAVPADSCW